MLSATRRLSVNMPTGCGPPMPKNWTSSRKCTVLFSSPRFGLIPMIPPWFRSQNGFSRTPSPHGRPDPAVGASISLTQGSELARPSPNLPTPTPAGSTTGAPAPADASWMAHPSINIPAAQADIFNAARSGDLPKLKTLLESDPTLVSSQVSCEMTPLLGAAAGGHADTATALIGAKADVNAKNWFNQTPLHYAASGGFKDVAELLITHGADVNARDKDGHTALYEAMNQVPWRKDVRCCC
jgi:hypothetical protein